MKKKIILLVLGIILFISIVTAGILDVLQGVERTGELSKADRDILLATSGLSEINISIDLECETGGCPDDCEWSAVQSGLISTYDNIIPRCINSTDAYTTEQLIDQIQAKVKSRLENYAGAINSRQAKIQQADGNIIFEEEK